MTNTQQKINEVCNSVRDLLLEKNRKYGDSALNPSRIFSKSNAVEQIKVRIDDKLSRISTSGTSDVDEDTLQDLIGYLVLLKIATEKVPFATNLWSSCSEFTSFPSTYTTYEDVLEDAAHMAAAGQELLNEYGLSDVDDQPLDGGDDDGDWEWDPNLGPVELSSEEIDMILRNRDISDSDPDEIIKVIEKRGFLLGVKANGNTCVLGPEGSFYDQRSTSVYPCE